MNGPIVLRQIALLRESFLATQTAEHVRGRADDRVRDVSLDVPDRRGRGRARGRLFGEDDLKLLRRVVFEEIYRNLSLILVRFRR